MDQQKCMSEFVSLSRIDSTIHPCEQTREFAECLRRSPASAWILSPTRRVIEFCFASVVLLVFSVPMLILAFGIRLESSGRAFFSQERVGRSGRLFAIYKFRSMIERGGKKRGPGLTKTGDEGVTPLGRFMRKFKIDELPQFYNILRGDMSLVGPRPKLPQYAAFFNMSYRPGITGPATVAFRHEEDLLQSVEPSQMNEFYAENIKPLKARLDACYMCRATPVTDLQIIIETLLRLIRPARKEVAALVEVDPSAETAE